jgi:peptidoglycan/xylan/chitin deacetylase (PgdA/CDA1 family)
MKQAAPLSFQIPILMYHSIARSTNPKFMPIAVSPASFAAQMAYLHQHSYTPINVIRLVRLLLQGSALPERPVVITFDDGFADFFTDALPVLQQYNFTATLYITTGFVGRTSLWLRHEEEAQRPILTWSQISEINACGIECGGHSHSHPQLDTLSLTKARDEIVRCKELLEDHLGQPVNSFAYPYGYHSAATKRLVREAGYTSACAVGYAMSSMTSDHFALARLRVGADTSREAFATLLTRPTPPIGATIYKRFRTSGWRLVRRCFASVNWTRRAATLEVAR